MAGHDRAAVANIGGHARHAARHRLADRVGEALAPGGTEDGDIQARHDGWHVGPLAEQVDAAGETVGAAKSINRPLAAVMPSPTSTRWRSIPSAASMPAAASREPWSFIG